MFEARIQTGIFHKETEKDFNIQSSWFRAFRGARGESPLLPLVV